MRNSFLCAIGFHRWKKRRGWTLSDKDPRTGRGQPIMSRVCKRCVLLQFWQPPGFGLFGETHAGRWV